ncbi:MAG: altronate dehydratase family protein [Bacteroidota bacterium]
MIKNPVLRIHPKDNLLVALSDLEAGYEYREADLAFPLVERIPQKQKFTREALAEGESVYLYGVLVGRTLKALPQGALITTANVSHAAESTTKRSGTEKWIAPDVSRWQGKSFDGYHRADGRVGTANYWLIIPLVFCENRNVKLIHQSLTEALGYQQKRVEKLDVNALKTLHRQGADASQLLATDIHLSPEELKAKRYFPNVDGIKVLTHDGGCGGTRQDATMLCRLLAAYIDHPNVAGATILSLGCQNAQISLLETALVERNPHLAKPLYWFEQQKSKSERELVAEAVKHTFVGLAQANETSRQAAPLSKLVIGLECGGSDGFSGITANPAIGYTSDLLVALGGTAILSEFPELCGVEQELANRCVSEGVAERFLSLMKDYSDAAEAVGSGFDMNPSPGNIRDGLITDAMKSAGAAKKGGTSPIVAALDYPEPVQGPGLHLLCTPGNDVESTTGLAGAGATVTLFTTGLGTPTGNPVSPVVKLATNTSLAERMPDIIDINTGTIITGEDDLASKGGEILDYIIEVASGRAVPKAVALGQDDFIPWKRGVSL